MAKRKRTTKSTKCTTAVVATGATSSHAEKITIKVPAQPSRAPANSERASTPLSDPPDSESELQFVDKAISESALAEGLHFVNHTPSNFGISTPIAKDHADHKAPSKKRKVAAVELPGPVDAVRDKGTYDDESEKEDLEPPRKFTVYVQVYQITPVLEKKATRGSKITTTTSFMSKGPFRFNTSQSFGKFKMEVLSVLSCDFSLLPVPKFEWKFEGQPQSAPRKKVADETGFQALLDAIKAKRATDNVVVWLYTPKPPTDEDGVRKFSAYMQLMHSHTENVGMGYHSW